MAEKVRLQKWLSEKGFFSRRAVEDFIRAGKITVNGKVATLGDRAGEGDQIAVNGKTLGIPQQIERIVIAYYKPLGVETTLKKIPGEKTIADIDFGVRRVFPIGRLDKQSQGLLLLTNDGDLAHKLSHPSFQKEKEYLVSVIRNDKKAFSFSEWKNLAQHLASGVMVDGVMSIPCEVEVLELPTQNKNSSSAVFRFLLREGRNRQIRKMCESLGLKVNDLLRIRVGALKLGEMKPGKWRILSKEEVKSLS